MKYGDLRQWQKNYRSSWANYVSDKVIGKYEEYQQLDNFIENAKEHTDDVELSGSDAYTLITLLANHPSLDSLRLKMHDSLLLWYVIDKLHECKLLLLGIYNMLCNMQADDLYQLYGFMLRLANSEISLTDKVFAVSGTLCSLGVDGNDVFTCIYALNDYKRLEDDDLLNELQSNSGRVKYIANELRFAYVNNNINSDALKKLILGDRKSLPQQLRFLSQPSKPVTPNEKNTDKKFLRKSF